jgi:hypothetical protein
VLRVWNKREYYWKYALLQKLFGNFTFLAIVSNMTLSTLGKVSLGLYPMLIGWGGKQYFLEFSKFVRLFFWMSKM